jgi:murein DD-endopeptidase MepM/ murein hydrolase activator NlpD
MRTGRLVSVVGVAILAAACQTASEPQTPPPSRTDVALENDQRTIEARVPRNATLETLLRGHNLPADVTASLVTSVRSVFNPRELRADRPYRISSTLDGIFREFRYQIDTDRLLRVVALGAGGAGAPTLDAEVVTLPRELALDALFVEIGREHASLVGAFDAAGEGIQLALMLADVFGGLVDFNSDLQNGDRIEVLFERATRHGEPIGYGEVRAAILENDGRRLTAVRFAGSDGKAGWYDEDGRSLKRQFLQSPLPFEPRITSRFSYRRLHPVHGRTRAHLGVDYGAPRGTPVKAVADGVVELAGRNGEAGNMVRLRHAGGYQTAYLHLSSFGPGIRRGVRVEQGQLIGRVGATGTATGPHLDYRIIKNGVYVNPLAELKRMPKGEPISAAARPAFAGVRDEALGELQQRAAAAATSAPAPAAGGRSK